MSARSARERRRLPAVIAALLLVSIPARLTAEQLPRPQGFVNDFAGVISAADARTMEAIITSLREQTRAEIAVVTVRSHAPDATIADFGIALAEEWGVGGSADDTGAILILALDERRVHLEVGYGLEGAIPDGRAGSILDTYVIPDLRAGDYSAGLLNGVAAVAQIVAEEYGVSLTGVSAEVRPGARVGPTSGVDFGDLVYVLFLLLFVGGRWFFWPLLFARRRRGFFGGGFGSAARGGSTRFSGFGGGGFGGGGASRGF